MRNKTNMMTNTFLPLFLLVIVFTSLAFDAQFIGIGVSDGQATINGMVVQPDGTIYVVGDFEKSVDLNSHKITCLYSDVFIARLDPEGHVANIVKAGGTAHYGKISVDVNGNVYVICTKTDGIWLAKYTCDLIVVWEKSFTSDDPGTCNTDLSVDKQGFIYVCGQFRVPFIIGSDTLVNPYQVDVKYYESSFVAKFDTSGTPVWAKSISPKGRLCSGSLCLDSTSNVYLYAMFDNNIYGDTAWSNYPWKLSFTKFSTDGKVLASKMFNFGDEFISRSIVYDSRTSDLFATGEVIDTMPGARQSGHFFILRLNTNLDTVFMKKSNGNSTHSSATCIALGDKGLVIAGFCSDSTVFDHDTLFTEKSMDFFAAGLDKKGDFHWATTSTGMQSSGKAYCGAVAVGSDGVYIAGLFEDTLVIANDSIFHPGMKRPYAFIVKLTNIDGSAAIKSQVCSHKVNNFGQAIPIVVDALGRRSQTIPKHSCDVRIVFTKSKGTTGRSLLLNKCGEFKSLRKKMHQFTESGN